MITIEGRFEVRLISSAALAQYMAHRDFTVRSLADRVADRLRATGSKVTCSRATIGHLRSSTSTRNTCHPDIAKAIEHVLSAPPGSLFVPRVSHVSREVGPRPTVPTREKAIAS